MEHDYKLINLNDIRYCDVDQIKKFLRFNGIRNFDEFDIIAMKKLINNIKDENMDGFNISYVIDRIDKEFDLIKLGDDSLINIELKSSYKDLEQCIENYRLLKKNYNNHNILVFCYESKNENIYLIDFENKKFILSSFQELNQNLEAIKNYKKIDININISSVYLNPNVYFEKKYTLSSSQKKAKDNVINGNKKINVIGGRAGSGKSLLALDIYDYYISKKDYSVCYLTPFKLNDVIDKSLIKQLNMKTIKDFIPKGEEYDVCIIDEAQRISSSNIDDLNNLIKYKIILLGDINQNIDFEQTFENLYNDRENNNVISMKQLIRTDDTFECFARKILGFSDKGIKKKKIEKSKIIIEMYNEKNIINSDNYIYIEPSKSLHFRKCDYTCNTKKCLTISKKCNNQKEPHTVISCEYPNVLLYLCDGYTITNNAITKKDTFICSGKLDSQLYAIITRATTSLKIITDSVLIYNFLMEKLEQM